MSITLDGQELFDNQQLEFEFGSISRDSIERTVAGLDGVVNIDLGRRGRMIKQKGALKAKSIACINQKINDISAFINGDTHTLITSDGENIADLRMDSFKVTKKRTAGGGVAVDYQIVYTQLMV